MMRKIQIILLALLFSTPLFANCDLAENDYQQAIESRKAKDYKKALAHINQAVKLCPEITAYYEQGKILFKLNRWDEALVSFESAYQKRGTNSGKNANVLARIAWVHLKKNTLHKASSYIEQAYDVNQQQSPRWILQLRKKIDISNAGHITNADEIRSAVTTELASKGAGATARVNFNAITFKLNSTELTPDGVRQVDELGKFLAGHKKTVTLIGHTDQQGESDYNLQLSIKRANAVKQRLQAQNSQLAGLIQTQGKGESELKFLGIDKTDHQLNRRVEMKL